jgi:diguanylate cyclase (GGDEF)-like protein/PAS domain S-box-containing protein
MARTRAGTISAMADRPAPFEGRDGELALRILELAPYVAMLVDAEAVVRWVSGSAIATTGYTTEDIVGRNVLDFIDLTWNPIALDSIGAALTRQGLQRAMLFRLVRKDGSKYMAEVQANSQWHDPSLNAMAVYVRRWDEQTLLTEVVEHVASRAPVGTTLELLTRVMGAETLEGAGVALVDVERGRCRRAYTAFDLPPALRCDDGGSGLPWRTAMESGSPCWTRVEELPEAVREAAAGAGFTWCWAWPLVSGGSGDDGSGAPDPGAAGDAGGEPPAGGAAGCLVLWRRADEEPDHTCRMLLENLVRITGLVLEREQQEARLRHSATHDPLTNLVNRATFFQRLQDALDRGSGPLVGVLYVDLDRFKPVNDTLGHGVGDQVLRAVAGRLLGAVRSGDLVARLGGDEFAVLCESIEGEAALEAIAARISESVARPFAVGDARVAIGASVGIAHASPGSCSIDVLMEAADAALYAVKAGGRGGWRIGLLA